MPASIASNSGKKISRHVADMAMPVIWMPTVLSLLIALSVVLNCCDAMLEGLVAPGGAASIPGVVNPQSHSNKSKISAALNGGGSSGAVGGILKTLSFGTGSKTSGGISAQSDGKRLEPVKAHSSGIGMPESDGKVPSAEEIANKIHKRVFLMDKTKEDYEKNVELRKIDDNAIQVVTDIYEEMPAKLKKQRAPYDAAIAKMMVDRFVALAHHHNHQNGAVHHHETKENDPAKQVLAIFSLAWDVKLNLVKKVDNAITIAANAIKFYQLGKDNVAFDVAHNQQESEVGEGELKEKMDKQKEQMTIFHTWLTTQVQPHIVGKDEAEAAKEIYEKMNKCPLFKVKPNAEMEKANDEGHGKDIFKKVEEGAELNGKPKDGGEHSHHPRKIHSEKHANKEAGH